MSKAAPSFNVSVMIPAFNAGPYLAAAIESVLAQTCRPLEVIVVDDGSTDDTAAIAERFGAPVICHRQPHGGIAASRNFAVSCAHGDWLAFLDADDLWLPDKLERQLAAAEQDPKLEMIFGGIRQFVSPELGQEHQAQIAPPVETSTAPHAGTMLARREVYARIGLFDDSLKLAEFIDWYARASSLGLRMATVPEIVMLRRRHLSNTTLRQKSSLIEMTTVMERVLDRRRQTLSAP